MNDNKKQFWQALKFTLFSISAGVIQIGSFAILEIFIKDYWIPYLISLVLSILWNFTLNRRYTFKSAANVPAMTAERSSLCLDGLGSLQCVLSTAVTVAVKRQVTRDPSLLMAPQLPVLPGESQGQGRLVGCHLWGCTESDMTEAT